MSDLRDYQVTIPEGKLDGVRVERFTLSEADILATAWRLGARAATPGTYTKLVMDGALWMSDTPAEFRDHSNAVYMIKRPETRRVLINGLGIGMVVKAAVDAPHVEHIDVVELDKRVVDLIGPHYEADPRVTIHHADAYTIDWPKGTRWDVVWNDIWLDLCTDNLDLMAKLHRKYGRRAGWQGSWGKELLRRQRDQERRSGWY